MKQYLAQNQILRAAIVAASLCIGQGALSSTNPFEFAGMANVTYTGFQVIMDDTLVYTCGYHGLQVYDISDPARIRLVSQLYIQNGGPTEQIVKSGNTIWAAGYKKAGGSGGSLIKIDASDPANMRIVAEYTTPKNAFSVALHGPDTVLVSWGRSLQSYGLTIYDFTNPENVTTQTVPLPWTPWGNIFVHGDLAFLGTGTDLHIIDLSMTPAKIVGTLQTGYMWWRFDARPGDTLLYVASKSAIDPALSSAFTVVNIADPAHPSIVSQRELYWYDCLDVMLVDTFLFVGAFYGMHIFNVSNPAVPDSVGTFPVNYTAGAMDAQNGRLFLADWGPDIEVGWGWDEPDPIPMYLCDISNLPEVTELGRYIQPAFSSLVAARGNYCYVSSDYDMGPDIAVIDVSNPASPRTVKTIEVADAINRIRIEGNYLFVLTDVEMGIYDLTDPSNPTRVGTGVGKAVDVRLKGEYALVAAFGAGLRVFDITPPESTHLVAQLPTPGAIFGLTVAGRYAYALSAFDNYTLMVDDPASPSFLTTWGYGGGGGIEALSGGGLVSLGFPVTVWSVADSVLPVFAYALQETGYDVAVSGDTAFVARGQNGIEAIVLEQLSARRIAEYSTPGQAMGIAHSGKYTYVADLYALLIFSDSDPTDVAEDDPVLPESFWVSQNYPNPFNPTTTVEFDLERTLPVVIDIYNTLGRLVHTYDLGQQAPGRHSITIDAQKIGMASGMYLYRVEAGRKEVTKKMMLVK